MKKIILALIISCFFAVSLTFLIAAEDVVYVSYGTGNNENSGLSDTECKKT